MRQEAGFPLLGMPGIAQAPGHLQSIYGCLEKLWGACPYIPWVVWKALPLVLI